MVGEKEATDDENRKLVGAKCFTHLASTYNFRELFSYLKGPFLKMWCSVIDFICLMNKTFNSMSQNSFLQFDKVENVCFVKVYKYMFINVCPSL